MNDLFETQQQVWDPLEAVNGSDQEILTAAKKREIKNILKSYVGTYDPMSELIQNAMDAVERRQTAGATFSPKLIIKIDLCENSFQVVDNGVGFTRDQFRAFIAPNISFKREATTRGNKGVGATYIGYGFNHLEIRTRNSEFKFQGQFRNGREWVEDTSGTIHRPQVEVTTSHDVIFDQIDQGSSFKIRFGGKNTRPLNLNWYQATTPEQWLYLLLLKTPLGYLNLENGVVSAVAFDLIVVDATGNELSSRDCAAKYKYPHEEIKASQRLSDVKTAQFQAVERGKDPSAAIDKFRNSNGIYEFYKPKDVLSFVRTLSAEEAESVESYNVHAYGYFVYSTSVWDHLNDTKAELRKGYRVLRGGLQMANNSMAQGDLITIPLSKNIGHQNQTHVVVHFSGAEPDLGRKGFQPELRTLS